MSEYTRYEHSTGGLCKFFDLRSGLDNIILDLSGVNVVNMYMCSCLLKVTWDVALHLTFLQIIFHGQHFSNHRKTV